MNKNNTLQKLTFFSLATFLTTSYASYSSPPLSYMPRIYLSGFFDTKHIATAQGDTLIPIYQQADQALFIYSQGHDFFHNNQYVLSSGLGFRQLMPNSTILGIHLLADYYTIDKNNQLWDISPAIEFLSPNWDIHANGYFPLNSKTQTKKGWADNFKSYDFIRFSNHERYDQWVEYHTTEQIAPGGDIEIGRKLFNFDNTSVKAYLGGYYFAKPNKASITGASLKLTIQPSPSFTIIANDTYDHYSHNTLMVGARIMLNKFLAKNNNLTEDKDISNRLFDPIQRNLGTATSLNAAITTKNNIILKGEKLEHDHIWFYDGKKNTDGDGTYENPFSYRQYQQTTIDTIHQQNSEYASIYLNPGVYQGNAISLFENQSIMGVEQNYKVSAINNKPLIIGTLTLPGNNTVDSVKLQNSNFSTGINITGNNIKLINDQIGDQSNIGGYHIGVDIAQNLQNILISNATIFSYVEGKATKNSQLQATGILIANGGSLEVNNSNINVFAKDASVFRQNGVAYGIHAEGQDNKISLQNSNILAHGIENGNSTNSGNGYGILLGENFLSANDGDNFAIHNNTLSITNSKITGTGAGNANRGYSNNGYGILIGYDRADSFHSNMYVSNNKINISNSELNGKGNNVSQNQVSLFSGNGYGLLIGYGTSYGDSSTIEVNNNQLNIQQGSKLTGIGKSKTDNEFDYHSGNGYGLILGYATGNGTLDVNMPIHDNQITINNGSLLGQGNANAQGSNFSGNGYGALIGCGDCSVDSLNSAIFRNKISSTNSDLIGNGNNQFGDYSGNGYGLLIGYGHYSYYTNLTKLRETHSLSINENDIIINNSKLISSGKSFSGDDSGNSYGLLIGYGYVLGFDGFDSINISINKNNIDIAQSTLSATTENQIGSYSGNSYGLLVGFNNQENYSRSIFSLANNQIIISQSELQSTTTGNKGIAYGINLGMRDELGKLSINNVLQATNNSFDIDSNGRDAWGIWMFNNAGELIEKNNTFRGNYKNGAHIRYPNKCYRELNS